MVLFLYQGKKKKQPKERSVIGAKALGRDDKEMLLPSTTKKTVR